MSAAVYHQLPQRKTTLVSRSGFHDRAAPSQPCQKISRADDDLNVRESAAAPGQKIRPVGGSSTAGSIRTSTPSPPPDDDDLDLAAPVVSKPGVDEIKKKMYSRECTRLGITPVGAFMREPTRSELQIRHYSLGPAGARALAVPLMLDSTLTFLDLEGNAIGPEGMANLREMLLDHCGITRLNLRRNNLGNRGALLICQVLQTNRLIRSINLSANDFDDKTGIFFANMLKANTTLGSLDLSDNQLAQVAGKQLGQALSQNETLESLDLCWNHFSGTGAIKLLEGVKENVGLKHLSLAYNCFGVCRNPKEKPPNILSDLLTTNTGLLSLDISANRLSDMDILLVAKGLTGNEALTKLRVGRNLVSVSAPRALLTSVLGNESSKLELLDMQGLPLAESDLGDVELLRSRGVKVVHGNVHQTETDFDSAPRPHRQKQEGEGEEEEGQLSAEDEGHDENEATAASATFITTTETVGEGNPSE